MPGPSLEGAPTMGRRTSERGPCMSTGERGAVTALVSVYSPAREQRDDNCGSVAAIHERCLCPKVVTRRCLRR